MSALGGLQALPGSWGGFMGSLRKCLGVLGGPRRSLDLRVAPSGPWRGAWGVGWSLASPCGVHEESPGDPGVVRGGYWVGIEER